MSGRTAGIGSYVQALEKQLAAQTLEHARLEAVTLELEQQVEQLRTALSRRADGLPDPAGPSDPSH